MMMRRRKGGEKEGGGGEEEEEPNSHVQSSCSDKRRIGGTGMRPINNESRLCSIFPTATRA